MANKYTKEEIRTYFETHRDDVKDVSAKFEVSQRTLYHWIKIEEWKQGKYANAGKETVQSDLVQTAIGSRLDYAKKKVINEIKSGFDESGTVFSSDIIQTRADEILLEAIGATYINKAMAEAAVIAKTTLRDMLGDGSIKQSQIISSAKDVVNIFSEIKRSIYGKEPDTVVQIANINGGNMSANDMATLSDEELKKLISEIKE